MNKAWEFLERILILYGLLQITYTVYQNRNFLTQNKILLVVVVVGCILLLLYIIYILKKSKKNIKSHYLEQGVKKDQEKIAKKTSLNEFSEILPSTKELSRLISLTKEEISSWDNNSMMVAALVRIDVSSTQTSMNIQTKFRSHLKKLDKTIWHGSLTGETIEESDSVYHNQVIVPFFQRNKSWKQVLIKAHQSIVDRLGDKYTLWIFSNINEMRIEFHSSHNSLISQFKFNYEYNTHNLINLTTKQVIN